MKSTKLIILLLLLKSIGASCQVIGLKDMPPFGSYFVFSNVTNQNQLDNFILSKKLHNNIWDFRGLDLNMDDTAIYSNAKSTILESFFYQPSISISWSKDDGSYIYKMDSSGQYELGYYSNPTFNYHYDNPVLMVKFPLQLGTINSDTVILKFDFLGWEVDSGLFDSTCNLSRGNMNSIAISDGIMFTNTDTFNCILIKQVRSAYKYKLFKAHNTSWKIIDSAGYLDQSTSYFLYSNSIEPVARIYPATHSDTGMYAMQYLVKSVLKTGIKNIEPNNPLGIYPNPATNELNITLQGATNCVYTIMDMMGKQIQTGTIGQSKSSIDISELNNGMYYLFITDKDRTSNHKFIKK